MTMRLLSVLLCLLLSVAAPSVAFAQSASNPAPLSQTLKGEAKQAYDGAKLLFEDGDPAGAFTKFNHAYEVSKEPRLLWNMAICEKELRHYASAARLVGRYLSEAGNEISAESRANALATQKALRGFYSELTLENLPTGARVFVDDVSAGIAPLKEPILVDLGQRRIGVELEGYESFEQQLEVPGATPVTLRVSLVALKTAASLSVTTKGKSDVISIDGKVVGNGQWRGSLPAGDHVLRVTAPGKRAFQSHIQLSPGGSRSLEVTLEDQKKAVIWPWLVGGAVLLAGAGVGGYFLLRSEKESGQVPQGDLGTIYLPALRAP
jgi:hypothetical protein